MIFSPSLKRREQGGCAGSLRCGKATNWDGGVRVPALVHWKDAIQPRKSNELFSALDVVPTFMNIVGHPIENMKIEVLHGVDQSRLIFQDEKVSKLNQRGLNCLVLSGSINI